MKRMGHKGMMNIWILVIVAMFLSSTCSYFAANTARLPTRLDERQTPGVELESGGGLRFFEDEDDFAEKLGNATVSYAGNWTARDAVVNTYSAPAESSADSLGFSSVGTATGAVSHSETNNQVEGVEELDTHVTDGRYIYAVDQDGVLVIEAYPVESASVVSRIALNNTSVRGVFHYENVLVVVNSWSVSCGEYETDWSSVYERHMSVTSALVYDVSDPENPELVNNCTASGYYVNSRMIDGYVYLLTNHYTYSYSMERILPTVWSNDARHDIQYDEIGYFEDSEGSSALTLITCVDAATAGSRPATLSLLKPMYGNVYVSRSAIYIAHTTWRWGWGWGGQSNTSIHKILIGDGQISYDCSCRVPGTVLNQFSMDEHDGYLRVATTSRDPKTWTTSNNVYILNGNMNIVGRLEGLAPGESIYSARFMGDRGYLVTFKKVDPFYVIDLSDPYSPDVLGYLKIPGFSNYMHPYDEDHVIGLGQDTEQSEWGNFAWFQGLKLSMFDVSDVEHPKEVAKLVIGDRGTSSPAQYDHKAFLFSREHGVIVIPVSVYERDGTGVSANTYGSFTFQGAYVISVDPENGFEVRGRVTHQDQQDADGDTDDWDYYYGYWNEQVTRALYIGDVLYTFSRSYMKMSDINTVVEMGCLKLRADEHVVINPGFETDIVLWNGPIMVGSEGETPLVQNDGLFAAARLLAIICLVGTFMLVRRRYQRLP